MNWRTSLERRSARYRAWWLERAPREQALLIWGGGGAGVVVLYLFLWVPLSSAIHTLQQQVPRDAARLIVMRREAAAVRSLRRLAPQPVGGNLMTVLEQTAKVSGTRQAIVRMEPSGHRRARVVLDHADFNVLLQWLADLQVRGIRVRRAAIERGTAPGQVSATLTLSEPGR